MKYRPSLLVKSGTYHMHFLLFVTMTPFVIEFYAFGGLPNFFVL